MLLRLLAIVGGAVLVTVPGVAFADETAIRWSAPPECPAEPALRAEIERLLGRSISPPERHREVSGEVTREPGASGVYRLRLSIRFGGGPARVRRIEGRSCALVTSAAAVVLALAMDAEPASDSREPGEPPPAAPFDDTLLALPPATTPPRAALPALGGRVWEIAAVEAIDFASLPLPAVGLGLRGAVDLGADRIELQLATWLPRRAALQARPSVGADLALHAAGVRYCRWITRRTFDLAPCGGLEAGVLVGSGFGAAPTTGLGRWLAPQIGLVGVARPSPRFALSVEVDGLAMLARDRFTILGGGEVYRPPQATLRVALAAAVRFP